MEINSRKRILLSRSGYIEDNQEAALLRLNTYEFKKGEPTLVPYKKDHADFWGETGLLVAVGINDGVGPSCYRVISGGTMTQVSSVGFSIPDVATLVTGEIRVYLDSSDTTKVPVWSYAYSTWDEMSKRFVKGVKPLPTDKELIFYDCSSGFRWFWNTKDCKREDDFATSDAFNQMFEANADFFKDVVSFTTPEGQLFESGQTVNFRIIPDIKRRPANKFKWFYRNEDLNWVEVAADSRGILTIPNVKETTEFLIEGRYMISGELWYTLQGTVSIYFGKKFYYGRYYGNLDELDPVNLENVKVWYKGDFVWDNIEPEQSMLAIAYPKEYGYLRHINDDNGLDYIHSYSVKEVTVGEESYLLYVKETPITLPTFKQVFTFYEPISLDFETTEMMTAWNNRNLIGGLVMLNSEGKIPTSLFDENSSIIVSLEGVYDYYPEVGMTPGALYYNTATHLLYQAITSTEGITQPLETNKIYSYNKTLYMTANNDLRPLSKSDFEEIDNMNRVGWLR